MDPFDALMPTRRDGCPPAVALEEYAFGDAELGVNEVADHLTGCRACSAEVENLRRERDAFHAARPSATFMASLEPTLPAVTRLPTGRRRRFAGALGLSFTAAAAAVVLLLSSEAFQSSGSEPGVRYKGAPALSIYVSRDGEPASPLAADQTLRPGDVLRFGVHRERAGYLWIVNVDDRGRVTRYVPHQGSAPLQVSTAAGPLPGSIRLDDFLGQELIVSVWSESPLPYERVRQAISNAYEACGGDLSKFARPEVEAEFSFRVVTKGPS